MEIPFRSSTHDDPTFLKKIPVNIRAGDAPIWGKAYAHEFTESTRVIVSLSLRITERLENGIGLKDLALKQTKSTL